MISTIIKENIDPLLSSLPWVENYGGYTIPQRIEQIGDSGPISQTFPYSPDYSVVECSEFNAWLVPGDQKQSILYIEETGEIEIIDPSSLAPPGHFTHFVSGFRVVAWYNYRKLGYASATELRSRLAMQLIKRLNDTRIRNDISVTLPLIKIFIDFENMSESGDTGIFSQYSYLPEYRHLLQNPYDFFALDFSMEFIVKNSCIPDPEILPSLEC